MSGFKIDKEGNLRCESCNSDKVASKDDYTICLNCGQSGLHNHRRVSPRGPAAKDRELWLEWYKREFGK